MKISLCVFLSLLLVFSVFSFPVLASDVEGSVAAEPVTELDASTSDQSMLEDINDTLGVIQSQLWIILVVGLLKYVYKFFRMFF